MTIDKNRDVLLLDNKDNVVVVLRPIEKGKAIKVDDIKIVTNGSVPIGHKIAIRPISKNEMVIKYGEEIGKATKDINAGDHVHVHNVFDITMEVYERKRKELGL